MPAKANLPLIVDPNAVLALAAPLQSLKPVPRWDSQIIQPPCLMQIQKLAPGDPLEGAESTNRPVIEESFSFAAPERADHVEMSVSRST